MKIFVVLEGTSTYPASGHNETPNSASAPASTATSPVVPTNDAASGAPPPNPHPSSSPPLYTHSPPSTELEQPLPTPLFPAPQTSLYGAQTPPSPGLADKPPTPGPITSPDNDDPGPAQLQPHQGKTGVDSPSDTRKTTTTEPIIAAPALPGNPQSTMKAADMPEVASKESGVMDSSSGGNVRLSSLQGETLPADLHYRGKPLENLTRREIRAALYRKKMSPLLRERQQAKKHEKNQAAALGENINSAVEGNHGPPSTDAQAPVTASSEGGHTANGDATLTDQVEDSTDAGKGKGLLREDESQPHIPSKYLLVSRL